MFWDALTVRDDPAEEPVGSILRIYLSYLKTTILLVALSQKKLQMSSDSFTKKTVWRRNCRIMLEMNELDDFIGKWL